MEKWPQRDFRLWTLGTRMQGVCSDLFGLSKEELGVIPRYELFPVNTKPRPFPKKNLTLDFDIRGELPREKILISYIGSSRVYKQILIKTFNSCSRAQKTQKTTLGGTFKICKKSK